MNPRDSSDERIPLAAVLSNEIKQHQGLNYLEVARVGIVTVPARVAEVAGQVLGTALAMLDRVGTADVRVLAEVSREKGNLTLEVLAQGVHLHLVVDLG